MQISDRRDLEGRIVEASLFRARQYRASGKYSQAEALSQQALGLARKIEGKDSALSGLALLELLDLYDAQGREEESEAAWESIRQVLISIADVAT